MFGRIKFISWVNIPQHTSGSGLEFCTSGSGPEVSPRITPNKQ
jgi:hypothetical protein